MTDELANAILELKRDALEGLVRQSLESERDPLLVLEACRRGMALVGERFQQGEYYLAELILSAELFKRAVSLLEPDLRAASPPRRAGRIVLATMRGDIHDLGKNLFATLLRAHGFEVCDLGVNVEPEVLVEKVRDLEPEFVGFSSLIAASFESTRRATLLLEEAGLRARVNVMLGGGVTSPTLRDYVGADFQTLDAVEAVQHCECSARANPA